MPGYAQLLLNLSQGHRPTGQVDLWRTHTQELLEQLVADTEGVALNAAYASQLVEALFREHHFLGSHFQAAFAESASKYSHESLGKAVIGKAHNGTVSVHIVAITTQEVGRKIYAFCS